MPRVDYFNDSSAPPANSLVPSVTAVIVKDGALLMIHKVDNDLWALPGGAVDLGETAADAARRETKEETGIDIEIDGLVGIYTDPRHVMQYDDGEVRQQFSLCFRGHAVGGALRPQRSEAKATRWVPLDDIAALYIHPSMRLRVDHGLAWTVGTAAYVG
jgi:ADP-ribose pyrophosphatase YjhB (NUDIX family)